MTSISYKTLWTRHLSFLSPILSRRIIEIVIVLILITQSHAQSAWDHVVDFDQKFKIQQHQAKNV